MLALTLNKSALDNYSSTRRHLAARAGVLSRISYQVGLSGI